MLTERSGLKILDFGLAKLEHETRHLTRSGTTLGTVAYMSPEQARGDEVGPRSDLWSLGVVLYEALTGVIPFRGERDHTLIYAILNEEPQPMAPLRPDLPKPVVRLIERLLEKNPEHRFRSATEVALHLEALMRGDSLPKTQVALPRTLSKGISRARRRSPVLLGAATLAAVLALAGAGYWMWRLRHPSAPAKTFANVAVLPFANLTGDADQDFLADGLAAVLVERLAALPGVNVVGRSETHGYRGKDKGAKQIAKELGVGAVIEGQVVRMGDALRVTADLVDGESGYVAWSKGFDAPPQEALRLAEQLAPEIATNLATTLSPEQRAQLAERPTQNGAAYEAYVKGLRIFDQVDNPQRLDLARDLLARAVELDPQFALARARLSETLSTIYTNSDPDPKLLAEAEAQARAALDREPELLAGHLALARVYSAAGKHDKALTELRQVVADHPQSDTAALQLGLAYQAAGDKARAEVSLRQAIALRPDYWKHWLGLGTLLWQAGDVTAARKSWEKSAELAPSEITWPLENLGALAVAQGDAAGALKYFDRIPRPINDPMLAMSIGTACFYGNRLDESEENYRLAARLLPSQALAHANLADVLVRRGQLDAARTEYLEAVRLDEEEGRRRTMSADDLLATDSYRAKAGECKTALENLGRRGQSATPSAESALHAAQIYAVCGDPKRALSELAVAVERGYPPSRLLAESEFSRLAEEPEFRRLTGAADLARR
jgi:TolB-like protein/Flp pilus assembly protein TadD